MIVAGFTVHPVTGATPKHGYQVAKIGNREFYSQAALIHETLTDIVVSFASRHEDLFTSDNVSVGGWVDPITGALVVEASETFIWRGEAIRAGHDRGQYSIWDNLAQVEVIL